MQRRPVGSNVIVWPDTTLRMMLALEFAHELTGEPEFADAYAAARQAFRLGEQPATFRFREEEHSYTYCSPASFFFAVLGHEDAAAAQAFIDHGPEYFCDFGWAVDRSWACDDLAAWYALQSA
jgi:hypothetical protein